MFCAGACCMHLRYRQLEKRKQARGFLPVFRGLSSPLTDAIRSRFETFGPLGCFLLTRIARSRAAPPAPRPAGAVPGPGPRGRRGAVLPGRGQPRDEGRAPAGRRGGGIHAGRGAGAAGVGGQDGPELHVRGEVRRPPPRTARGPERRRSLEEEEDQAAAIEKQQQRTLGDLPPAPRAAARPLRGRIQCPRRIRAYASLSGGVLLLSPGHHAALRPW